MILVWIVLYLLFFLLLLLTFIVLVPFEYYAAGEKYDKANLAIELSWLFRLIHAALILKTGSRAEYFISLFGFKIDKGYFKKNDAGKDSSKKAGRNKIKKPGQFPDKDFILKTISFIRSIFKRIKPYQFEIDGKYGFDEPYNTAIFCSIAGVFCCREESGKINAVPVFDEEILEGRFLVRGRIIPGLIIFQAAGYILSKPVRKIIFS